MAKGRKKTPLWLTGVWVLNFFGLVGLIAYLLLGRGAGAAHTRPRLAPVSQSVVPAITFTASAVPTQPPPPTAYILPSVTPNPRSTLVVGTTPTAPAPIIPLEVLVLQRRPAIIGYSVLGRPLEIYRFGNGAHERLIVANIHGGYEWNTANLADELIQYLTEHPTTIPSDVSLYVLRSLNPDGYERSHDYAGRVNENGVDLNHNFPYRWEKDWNRDGCWNYLPTTGGAYAASEPETIALMNFIERHNFEALISYHSAALGIFAGGIPSFAPSEDLAKKLSQVSPYRYPPLNTGCSYSGNLTDWASSVKSIPSVDIELSNHRDTDFEINLRVLNVFLKWGQ